jgi:hypothetical protein
MSWFAAHLVMYVKLKHHHQEGYPLWENIILIKAASEAEAFAKAEQRGHDEEGDDEGSFRWAGKPARWVFAGVRKVALCQDAEKRPNDGTELSYTEMEVASQEALDKLLAGEAVSVQLMDRFPVPLPEVRGSE